VPKLIDVDEAARRLGITRRHVFRLIERHALTRFKKGGDRRVYLDAAELRRLKEPRPVGKQR